MVTFNWTSTTLDPNGDVSALCHLDNGYIVALCRDSGSTAIWVSTNGGVSWSLMQTVSALLMVVCDLGSGTVIAADSNGYIWTSTNHGTSWTQAGSPVAASLSITSLLNLGSGVVLLGSGISTTAYIYRSTNSGASWTLVYTGSVAISVTSFAVLGTSIFGLSRWGYLYKSTNAGVTWTNPLQITAGTTWMQLLVTSSTDMFAVLTTGTFKGVYFSTNSGATWTLNGSSSILMPNANCSTALATVYGGRGSSADCEIWVSTNEGITSTELQQLDHPGYLSSVDSLIVLPSGNIIAGTSIGNVWLGNGAPTVTGVSPATGPLAGGTSVTITGTGFSGGSASVKFGSTNAASFTINSDTSITAVSPAGSAGTVDITVTSTYGTSATSSSDQFLYRTVISPVNMPYNNITGIEVSRTMQDAYWKCTVNIDGYTDFTNWSQVAPWVTDYLGNQQQVFLGVMPYAQHNVVRAANKTTLTAYSYDYALSHNPVPRSYWTTPAATDPGQIVSALLATITSGGTAIFTAASGNPEATPNWGTSTLPAKQFSWTEKTTIQDAINEMQAYCQMLFICTWPNGTPTGPIWYWIPQTALDTDFTTLPAGLTFTPGGVQIDAYTGVDITQKTSDGYNQVLARGQDSSGAYYECLIDSTGLIWYNGSSTSTYVTVPSGAPFTAAVIPVTYTDPANAAYNTQALVTARAKQLYQFLVAIPYVYKMDLIGRTDLRLYQKIQFTNFQAVNQSGVAEAVIPQNTWLRVVGITYKMQVTESGFDTRVSIQCTTDTYLQLSQKNLLVPVMGDNNPVTEIKNIATAVVNNQPKNKIGTITAVGSNNQVTVLCADGTTVTAVIPQ